VTLNIIFKLASEYTIFLFGTRGKLKRYWELIAFTVVSLLIWAPFVNHIGAPAKEFGVNERRSLRTNEHCCRKTKRRENVPYLAQTAVEHRIFNPGTRCGGSQGGGGGFAEPRKPRKVVASCLKCTPSTASRSVECVEFGMRAERLVELQSRWRFGVSCWPAFSLGDEIGVSLLRKLIIFDLMRANGGPPKSLHCKLEGIFYLLCSTLLKSFMAC